MPNPIKRNRKLINKHSSKHPFSKDNKNADGDSLMENVFEFVDVTGISSWDDVYRSTKDNTQGTTTLEIMGALPFVGKFAKIVSKTSKTIPAKIIGYGPLAVKGAENVQDVKNLTTKPAPKVTPEIKNKPVSKFTTEIKNKSVNKKIFPSVFAQQVWENLQRDKKALGGVVDYANNSSSQLLDLLGQFVNLQSSNNNSSDFSEPILEDEELELEEESLLDDEELEIPEDSIFGPDFLNGNPLVMGNPNLYLEDDTPSNYTVTPGGDFTSHIVAKESGGRYDAMSPNSSATGKYQFLWGTHGKRIQQLTGVKSREEFANNPQAQEAYYAQYIKDEVMPQVSKYKKGLQKYFPNISDDQIIAAYHFAGPGNLSNAIKTGNFDKALDANGTSILSYITPNKKNMKKKKYESGGEVWGQVAKGAAELAPTIMGIIDTLNQGYSNQPVVTSRQSTQYNPYSRDFGNSQLPMFALGGQVPIEAEGNEVVETPNGMVGELQGPTHEQGGIDMDVPQGTKIYSDRLSVDGKTMAERKKSREKALARLEKLALKNPHDKLLKNSLERTKQVMDMEEAQDMKLQEVASSMTPRQGFALGTPLEGVNPITMPPMDTADFYNQVVGYGVAPPNLTPPAMGVPSLESPTGYFNLYQEPITPPVEIDTNQELGLSNPIQISGTSAYSPDKGVNAPITMAGKSLPQDDSTTENNGMGATIGDYIGMGGNLFNAFAPLINTLRNRNGEAPNVNHYKNFGKDALQANESAKDYVALQRENALRALRQKSNAAKASTRDNARSVNTVRALDLATDTGTAKDMDSISDAFAKQMMQLFTQQAQLENVQDQAVMTGEEKRAENDVKDRDNYQSQLAQNLTNLGTNVQGLGKNLNTIQGNKDQLALLEMLSQYGFGFTRDRKGNLQIIKK